jgi:MFS transporter, PHS family, inorganic phosphate transporter
MKVDHPVSSLEIFSFFMLTGIFSTLLLPETKGRTLEELSNENQEGFVTGNFGYHICSFNIVNLSIPGIAAKIEVQNGIVVAQH